MEGMSSRRGFLRSLVGEVVRGAQEIAPVLNLPGELGGSGPADADALTAEALPAPAVRRTVRGLPVERTVTLEELLALASELGLAERLDVVRALARRSFRLTLADEGAEPGASEQATAPAMPDLAADVPWPDWNGDTLPFLAQIDLGALGADAASTPLPTHGLLSIFCSGGGALARSGPAPADAVRVLWLEDAAGADGGADRSRPTRLGPRTAIASSELTLPRVWAATVQAFDLDAGEQRAWQELRRRLAELQRVAPAEDTETVGEIGALHRLLGYPDERGGTMPLACELAARGIDLEDAPAAYAHPRARELEPHTARWRLLLQLTVDDELGWTWGEHRDRLYLWIDEADLAAHDFSRVWAIAQ